MARWGNTNMVFQGVRQNLILSDFISYWDCDLDFNDSVGNNDEISRAGISSTTDRLVGARALSFSGTSPRIVVGDDPSLSFGNGVTDVDYSIITLVKFNSLASFPRIYEKNNETNTQREYRCLINTAQNNKLLGTNTDFSESENINYLNNVELVTGSWYVLTTVYKAEGKQLTSYVDNAAAGVLTPNANYVAMANGTGNLNIGANANTTAGNNLNGIINAMAILKIAMTPEQVAWSVNKFKVDNDIDIIEYQKDSYLSEHTDDAAEVVVMVMLSDNFTGGTFVLNGNETNFKVNGDVIYIKGTELHHLEKIKSGYRKIMILYLMNQSPF